MNVRHRTPFSFTTLKCCMYFQHGVDFGCMSPFIAAAQGISRQLSIPSFSLPITPHKLPSHDQFCPSSTRLKAEGAVQKYQEF